MGASNVSAAFHVYAGRIPPLAMNLLTFMANTSKDADPSPWYGGGHEALARGCLGRGRHRALITRSDVKAVERGIQPLLDIGAITADRPAAPRAHGPRTVRYRLHLDVVDIPRKTGDDTAPDIDQPTLDDAGMTTGHPPNSGRDFPRKTASRPPNSGHTSPGIRGTEETRGTKRSENYKEESLILDTDVTAPRTCGRDGCAKGWIIKPAGGITRCPTCTQAGVT